MWFRCSIVLFGALLVEWPALVQSFEAKCHVKYHIHSRVNSTSVTWKQAKDVSKEKSFFIASYRLNFDPIRPTRIFVHGYKSDTDLMDSYAQAYLNAGNFNFIAVDWLAGASTWNYLTAKDRVPEVGKALATFIDHLVNELGMQLHDLILVGHSLGAHVCGWAGKSVKTGKLPVIIGLDPALPGFEIKNGKKRLNHTDASYVQIIHTSGGFFGIKTPLGHSDFYINYGCKQPGCSGMTSQICSHQRVHDIFQESLHTPVWAKRCESYEEIIAGHCTNAGVALMGGDAKNMERAFGFYYVETRDKAPFVKPEFNQSILKRDHKHHHHHKNRLF